MTQDRQVDRPQPWLRLDNSRLSFRAPLSGIEDGIIFSGLRMIMKKKRRRKKKKKEEKRKKRKKRKEEEQRQKTGKPMHVASAASRPRLHLVFRSFDPSDLKV
ncbi:hypothetical protein SODALDRAFT_220570 [Sodiomyces alkalinus F11]|uniref:Uncharacterized protein n=1 Tax=Sodiomyces alkalinus (strain CBS 110278 / VKM F-3762 / F11) TaxID=1314773 RepID=A0A3N2PPQ9_SODAK|nr:hypothetical protein SODALDRAFT_220570 [Sodiomyces alkalinus F11]ROT36497.1 hypothetical protein SODALDRAFT_220570 [Sodiomyces alkalinus F11]